MTGQSRRWFLKVLGLGAVAAPAVAASAPTFGTIQEAVDWIAYTPSPSKVYQVEAAVWVEHQSPGAINAHGRQIMAMWVRQRENRCP